MYVPGSPALTLTLTLALTQTYPNPDPDHAGTLAPVEEWASLLITGLCGNPYMKWSKTLLLQTAAKCTDSKLSSKFLRSRYQVYSPYNDTEDEGLLNKFVDEEPGKAGVMRVWLRLITYN